MKGLLYSIMVIALVGGIVGGGLFAHFQDTETSTGNEFQAGFVDLEIDVDGQGPNGDFVPGEGYNGVEFPMFGNFATTDWKPCTSFEKTLSLHLIEGSNNCPVIMEIIETKDAENGILEPELECNPNDTEPDGELDNYVEVTIWYDDGDNILEEGEIILVKDYAVNLVSGPIAIDADPSTPEVIDDLVACTTYYLGFDVHFLELEGQNVSDAMTDQWGFKVVFSAIHP